MKFLRQTLAIAAKDLRSEIRGKEAVNASVSFALVILLLFSFAFDLEPEQNHVTRLRDRVCDFKADAFIGTFETSARIATAVPPLKREELFDTKFNEVLMRRDTHRLVK